MIRLVGLITMLIVLTGFAVSGFCQTKINGLEARKGRDLAAESARHAAEVTSLTKSYSDQQAKLAATTDAKTKANLQKRSDETAKRLAAAQKTSGNSARALSDWQTAVLKTHKAKAGSKIDWTKAQIAQ